jgi:hypothetical protein
MIRKPLITIDDIKAFRPVAEIPQARLDPYILESQQQELRPLMNDALYTDFMTKFDNSVDPMYPNYQTLLKGTTYIYAGQTIEFPGIKAIIVYYALARFIQSSPININTYGIVQKKVSESDPISPEDRRIEATNLRAQALSYADQLKKFLYINIATYPLYGFKYSNQEVNRTGFPFF